MATNPEDSKWAQEYTGQIVLDCDGHARVGTASCLDAVLRRRDQRSNREMSGKRVGGSPSQLRRDCD